MKFHVYTVYTEQEKTYWVSSHAVLHMHGPKK